MLSHRKRTSILAMVTAMVLGLLSGCGQQNQTTNTASQSNGNPVASKDQYKIAVTQFIEHPSLDQTYQGFLDGLKAKGLEVGKNLTVDFTNAQGDQSIAQTIAGQFANNNADLIFAIATPSAQALANTITDRPIVVGAVTDFVSAHLVQSNEKPGGNITGVSDLTPIKDQIDLIKHLLPNAKTLGIIYSSGEANSEVQAIDAKKTAEENGFDVQTVTISGTNDIQQVTESIIDRVDALWLPADNALASAMATVAQIALQKKVPIFPAVEAMAAQGGLASISINYHQLGQQAADMAYDILVNGRKPADLPIQIASNPELVINEDYAKTIGYTFPDDIQQKARPAKVD